MFTEMEHQRLLFALSFLILCGVFAKAQVRSSRNLHRTVTPTPILTPISDTTYDPQISIAFYSYDPEETSTGFFDIVSNNLDQIAITIGHIEQEEIIYTIEDTYESQSNYQVQLIELETEETSPQDLEEVQTDGAEVDVRVFSLLQDGDKVFVYQLAEEKLEEYNEFAPFEEVDTDVSAVAITSIPLA